MVRQYSQLTAPRVVLGVGGALFVASVTHHVAEVPRLGQVNGPVLAFALDGTLALAVAYGGYWLVGSDLAAELRWVVAGWCLLGGAVLVGTAAATIAIREHEGRAVSEPAFLLLVAGGAGALGGLIAGYYDARTRESARQAQQAVDALEFLNDLLRHDVRNHMNAIFLHAETAERETADEAVADSVRTVSEQARQVTALVENSEAVVEAVSGDPELGRIDLAAVAEECAEEVDDRFAATVTTDLPDRAPVVANEALRPAVHNLVENAAEHNDAADTSIQVSATDGAETARLRVADDGVGIRDSRKEAVFEPDEADRHGGGLHLTETLVTRFGGDVWVEDSDYGGAAFVVELPRANGA